VLAVVALAGLPGRPQGEPFRLYLQGEAPTQPLEEIVRQFAAKEEAYARAHALYRYRLSVKVQEVDEDNQLAGEFEQVADVGFDPSGRRRLTLVGNPRTDLSKFGLTRVELDDLDFIPLFILGFSTPAIFAYVVFVTFHALFIHANVGFNFGWLDWVIATPRFHHWHHAIEAEAVDKNFGVHLPVIDKLFGSLFLPRKAWPAGYGIGGHPVPEHYLKQVAYPFAPQKLRATP